MPRTSSAGRKTTAEPPIHQAVALLGRMHKGSLWKLSTFEGSWCFIGQRHQYADPEVGLVTMYYAYCIRPTTELMFEVSLVELRGGVPARQLSAPTRVKPGKSAAATALGLADAYETLRLAEELSGVEALVEPGALKVW
jgi:hypothetical protein